MEYSKNQLGYLYFEYSDVCAYTWRHPLIDKVAKLYHKTPGILKLNSVDLSPASWMAITWSPIGYIPILGLRKKVSTYFITYHTISALFQENTNDETKEGVSMLKKKHGGIPLPPFGIASYKMQNDVWMDKAQASTIYDDLHGAANCWLKQLNYYHHDFSVFTSNARNLDYIYLF
ncbi:hypothetical protein R3W88_000157 [Solanum pinnatisectum]|uniref:Uncharacterized protein n=1 Tax=Solanum pinnatisectum TaxID=50273 RepID=A0AAV9MHV9_9SOLN|nr:hypothetical protein R3W88_000157 [Solanum pinnatisectum]